MGSCLDPEPQKPLDPKKRYCLVDTMVLLQIYRRNPKLAAMAEIVRDGRVLLLVPDVIDECYSVFIRDKPDVEKIERFYVGDESGNISEYTVGPVTQEDVDVEPGSRDEFDCILEETLRMRGTEFAVVLPKPDARSTAGRILAGGRYRNSKGVPLSPADCLLLGMAVGNPNVDILTDDKALGRAVEDMCGPGRSSVVLNDYFGRLNMTARFLSRMLGIGFVDCRPYRDRIDYYAANMRLDETGALLPRESSSPDQDPLLLIAVRYQSDGAWLEDGCLPRIKGVGRGPKGRGFVLCDFVSLVAVDWYCACGDTGWAKFDQMWTKHSWFEPENMEANDRLESYREIARSILKENRRRYCSCARPEKRKMHEAFRSILSATDQ